MTVQILQKVFSCLFDRSISTIRKRERGSSPGALTLSRKNPKRVRLEMTESGGPSQRRIDDVLQL
jgi:hypothetical protein